MSKTWLKEISRDLLALGSIPFYFLVVIRAIIGKYNAFVYQMLIAAIAVFILYFVIKDSNLHIARSFTILIFTSLFYKEAIFTTFAFLAWVLLLVSAYYIKRKIGSVFRGIIIGVIGSLAGYYGAIYLI
ncbi:hypothetical protein HYX00_03750 [Candidatus Woesearchaeota archaeon]|nr:hypothetical protein [Candidatus Woesearchaeota archaeon]